MKGRVDSLDAQAAAVRHLGGLPKILHPMKGVAVTGDTYDVLMAVAGLHLHVVAAAVQLKDKMEGESGLQKFHLALAVGHEPGGGAASLVGYRLQHLHMAGGVTGQRAQGAGRLDTGHTAGIGDADATHVFDDVTAAPGGDPLRVAPQRLPPLGGGVGQGDGLGAAHGGHQFLAQNGEKILLYLFVHILRVLSTSLSLPFYQIRTGL